MKCVTILQKKRIHLSDNRQRLPRFQVEQAFNALEKWQKRSFVIKLNMTNFGRAVEIFHHGTDREHYESAVSEAFCHGDTVLAEEFFPGREYRFLVIGEYDRGVLHRVPANVNGDGISSISTLVKLKDHNPRRSRGYVSSQELLNLGTVEKGFLASRDLSADSVPVADVIICLRENPNPALHIHHYPLSGGEPQGGNPCAEPDGIVT